MDAAIVSIRDGHSLGKPSLGFVSWATLDLNPKQAKKLSKLNRFRQLPGGIRMVLRDAPNAPALSRTEK